MGGVERNLSHCIYCSFRPAYLLFWCVGRKGGTSFRPSAPARSCGRIAGAERTARLGVPVHEAQPDLGQRYPRPPAHGKRAGTDRSNVGPGGDIITTRKRADAHPSAPLRALIEKSLDDDKAEDIVVIDLAGKSDIADFLVIASGRSTRQVATMAEHLRERIKAAGLGAPQVEGLPQGDWVLVDAGDIVVHLFRPEVRSFYNLEKMWGRALPAAAHDEAVRVDDLHAARARRHRPGLAARA